MQKQSLCGVRVVRAVDTVETNNRLVIDNSSDTDDQKIYILH